MSEPRASVVTTVYNRPRRVLFNTFYALRRNDLRNTEIIIVDDGSTKDYSRTRGYLDQYEVPYRWLTISTVKDRPDTYNIDGYNNPVYAWNTGLDAARGEIIIVLASDCIIPPNALNHARKPGRAIWMSGVIDMDSGMEYLGKKRLAPYGWFMSWNRSLYDVRWDENYLKGMAYDDNDMTARLALAARQVSLDFDITAFHQSHPPTAYSDGHRGHDINERYTWKKWGGVPWTGNEYDPLECRQAVRNGMCVLNVKRKETLHTSRANTA